MARMRRLSGKKFSYFIAITLLLGLAGVSFSYGQGSTGGWTANHFLYKPAMGARGVEQKKLFDSGLDAIDTRLGQTVFVTDPAFGAKGDGVTNDTPAIQNAINTIHNSGGGFLSFPKGSYKTTDNITIPTDLSVELSSGAIINIASGKTLTVNGPIKAGLWQIFGGDGAVAGDPKNEYIIPQWFGAKGDNTTDDAAALNKAANLARTANCKRLKLPACAGYQATQQVDLRQLNIEGNGPLYTSYAGAGVLIGNGSGYDISLTVNRVYDGNRWNSGNIGIQASDLNSSKLTLAANYHEIGIKFMAGTGSCCYNTITLKYVNSNKKGLQVHVPAGNTTGWVNENLVLGGCFGNTDSGGVCAVELLTEGTNIIDKWTFIKPDLEYTNTDLTAGFIFNNAQNCQAHDARWESGTNKVAQFLNGANNNIITLGSFDYRKGLIDWDEAGPSINSSANDVRMSSDGDPQRLNDIANFDAAYDDGSYIHVPGFQFFGLATNTGVTYRKIANTNFRLMDRGKGAALNNPGWTYNYGCGLMVKFVDMTTIAKKLYVRPRRSLNTTYIGVVCFDSSMNILSGTSPYYVKGSHCTSSSSFYLITNASPHAVLLFNTNVAYALVGTVTTSSDTGYVSGLDIMSPYTADAYVTYTGPFEYPGKLCASQAPTKWHFKQGDMVWNDGAAAGGAPGWVCIKRTESTLSADASGGNTTVTVASITGLASGDVIGVKLNTGLYHFTTINGAPSGNTVTLTAAIPGSGVVANSGNALVANLWKAMANLGN